MSIHLFNISKNIANTSLYVALKLPIFGGIEEDS